MEIIKYELKGGLSITSCPNGINRKVGSNIFCTACEYHHSVSREIQEVVCKYKDTIKKDYVLNKSAIRNMERDLICAKQALNVITQGVGNLMEKIDNLEKNIKSLVEGE